MNANLMIAKPSTYGCEALVLVTLVSEPLDLLDGKGLEANVFLTSSRSHSSFIQ